MLAKPLGYADKAQSMRVTFNVALNEILLMEGHTYIMQIDSTNNEKFLDASGKLLASGRVQFWKEMDQIIKDFDRKKSTLMPFNPNAATGEEKKPITTKKSTNDRFHVDNRECKPKRANSWHTRKYPQGAHGSGEGFTPMNYSEYNHNNSSNYDYEYPESYNEYAYPTNYY